MNNIQINGMLITLASTFQFECDVICTLSTPLDQPWSGNPFRGIFIISSCTNNDSLKLRIALMWNKIWSCFCWVLNSMFLLSNKTNVGEWKMVFKRCTKFLTHLRSFCSAFSAREIFCFLTHLRSFCSAFSAREIFCLSRSCLSPYRVWNININNSWSVFLFSDHADLVDCVCWYFAEGAEMYKLLNLRAELFLCTVSTTALLIYTPRVISELAYFQVAIKLLYSFQLVIERMSSLSS